MRGIPNEDRLRRPGGMARKINTSNREGDKVTPTKKDYRDFFDYMTDIDQARRHERALIDREVEAILQTTRDVGTEPVKIDSTLTPVATAGDRKLSGKGILTTFVVCLIFWAAVIWWCCR